jgi:hypothetical protein
VKQHSPDDHDTRSTSNDPPVTDDIPSVTFTVGVTGAISPPHPPTTLPGYVGGNLILRNLDGYTGYVWATQGGYDQCRKLVVLPPGEDAMEPGGTYTIQRLGLGEHFTITTTQPNPDGDPSNLPRYGTNGDIHVLTPPLPGDDGHGHGHGHGHKH